VRRNSRNGVSRLRAHAVRPENDDGRPVESPLLLVVLHDLRVADARGVRVVSRFAEGAPLAKQIPALVESDLDRFESAVLALAQGAFGSAFVELLLLGNELLDSIVDLIVFHLEPPHRDD
jgi:hypothetical protein